MKYLHYTFLQCLHTIYSDFILRLSLFILSSIYKQSHGLLVFAVVHQRVNSKIFKQTSDRETRYYSLFSQSLPCN